MNDYKVVSDRTEANRRDSLFYRSTEWTPLKVVEYQGRQWEISPYGEVEINYKGARYGCLSEITEIKTDADYFHADEHEDLEVYSNNWYEIRPVGEEYYEKYVQVGLYDDIFWDPDDLDQGIVDAFLAAEKEYDQVKSNV